MFSVSRGSSVSGRSEMCIKMINAQNEIDIDIPHISLFFQTCCINAWISSKDASVLSSMLARNLTNKSLPDTDFIWPTSCSVNQTVTNCTIFKNLVFAINIFIIQLWRQLLGVLTKLKHFDGLNVCAAEGKRVRLNSDQCLDDSVWHGELWFVLWAHHWVAISVTVNLEIVLLCYM